MYINKKKIIAENKNGKWVFPTLYSVSKTGADLFWEIYVKDNGYQRLSGQVEGKIKDEGFRETVGKNIGRANETTPLQQALFEAQTKWDKKREKDYDMCEADYKKVDVEDAVQTILPMLAKKYVDRQKINKLTFPYASSRKMDGVRAINSKKDSITSRTGKEYTFLLTIKDQLNQLRDVLNYPSIIFDGEAYSHDIPFEIQCGICRTAKEINENDHLMEYWIFDVITDTNFVYKDRMEQLKQIEKVYNRIIPEDDRVLRFVYYEMVNNHEEMIEKHNQYVEEGFEGIMLRTLDSKYMFKHRSTDLLKYKDFVDEEFEIVGYKEGEGHDKGCVIFKCYDPRSEQIFEVRPRGTREYRADLFENGDSHIGKQLTVRHQLTSNECATSDLKPRFPVGIVIRDYE